MITDVLGGDTMPRPRLVPTGPAAPVSLINLRHAISSRAVCALKGDPPKRVVFDRPMSGTGGYGFNIASLETFVDRIERELQSDAAYAHVAKHIKIGRSGLPQKLTESLRKLCGYMFREIRDNLKNGKVETVN